MVFMRKKKLAAEKSKWNYCTEELGGSFRGQPMPRTPTGKDRKRRTYDRRASELRSKDGSWPEGQEEEEEEEEDQEREDHSQPEPEPEFAIDPHSTGAELPGKVMPVGSGIYDTVTLCI